MIPIFEGREATYNKLILETLITNEPLTTWEIAKQIEPTVDMKGDTYHRTQKVYSVLVRKRGRLEDLASKNYISLDEDTRKYRIDLKGIFAILIEKPELKNLIHPASLKLSFPHIENRKASAFGITVAIDGKQLRESMISRKPEEYRALFWLCSLGTKKLVEEGINLDRIHDETLWVLLAKSKEIQEWVRVSRP